MIVEHSDLGVPPDGGPVGKPQRHVLVVVEDRNLHGPPPSLFGGKELGQSSRYGFGIVFHRTITTSPLTKQAFASTCAMSALRQAFLPSLSMRIRRRWPPAHS